MTIEWDKIKNAPSKSYKILGSDLLSMADKIDQLQNTRNELTKQIESIEGTIKNIQSENSEKDRQINTLQGKVAKLNELVNALETTISNKDESMGSVMNMHANFMKEIERLNEDVARNQEEISDLKKVNSELEKKKAKLDTEKAVLRPKISELHKALSDLEDKIPSLEKQLSQEQNEVATLKNSNSELQAVIQTKETNLKQSDEKINNLTTKIAGLNAQIEELKDQIPKKVVYEKADEVVKGTGCPHCGFTINEEYKVIDGKKSLIRKYCPNPNFGFNIQESPRADLAVELEVDVPEDAKIIKIFEVTKEGIEEVSRLNSQMVAIIADTAQDIIWIWRGSESDRFIYAEATREVGKVKNEIMKLSKARIERIEEGSEPDNFQTAT